MSRRSVNRHAEALYAPTSKDGIARANRRRADLFVDARHTPLATVGWIAARTPDVAAIDRLAATQREHSISIAPEPE